jgi:all-trans-retinol dehydrogenase (NAD+)
VYFFSCDITSPKAVKESASAVTGFLGAPTILVNNAGIAYAHTILEAKPMELRKLFDVNIISHFYTLQAFLPEMIKRKKGHVVSIASMASFAGVAELTDYCATKAGVLALHEGLNQELKYRYDAPEIKTTIIHPTYVKTTLVGPYRNSLREAGALVLQPETVANAVISSIINGRSGQVILPKVFSIISLCRGLSHWFQELVRDTTRKDIMASKAT